MLDLFRKCWPFGSGATRPAVTSAMKRLVARTHYEIVPMASIEQAIGDLPERAPVSITCSPVKGIPATQEFTARLATAGHDVVPHLAARMVASADAAAELADWVRSVGLTEVFVIAGDPPAPHGPYAEVVPFLSDFLGALPGVARVGVAGYPDGHALIDDDVLDEALLAKQALLDDHGFGGWVSTQMCFDADTTLAWLRRQRDRGLELPVRLGVPGVVDQVRLMKVGARLGVGASLRYLAKNRATVVRLMTPGGYDPTDLVAAIAPHADELGIEGLHSFTFNAVADTHRWQEAILTAS